MTLRTPEHEITFHMAGIRGGSRHIRIQVPVWYDTIYGPIVVPSGVVSDGASIPRVFWSIIDPWGPYFPAALIHDYLYKRIGGAKYPKLTRKQIDNIFVSEMKSLGVDFVTRHTMHKAVRAFGWRMFRKE